MKCGDGERAHAGCEVRTRHWPFQASVVVLVRLVGDDDAEHRRPDEPGCRDVGNNHEQRLIRHRDTANGHFWRADTRDAAWSTCRRNAFTANASPSVSGAAPSKVRGKHGRSRNADNATS